MEEERGSQMKDSRAISLALSLAVIVGLLAACGPTPTSGTHTAVPTQSPKGGSITYGLTLIVSGIDPHQGASYLIC